MLPSDAKERKGVPIYSGVLKYFPDAIAYIAKVSKFGNDQHNFGQPLHWSREKSGDHHDCAARHLLESGTVDGSDGLLHSGKLAWRALAILQLELEAEAQKVSEGDDLCKQGLHWFQYGICTACHKTVEQVVLEEAEEKNDIQLDSNSTGDFSSGRC